MIDADAPIMIAYNRFTRAKTSRNWIFTSVLISATCICKLSMHSRDTLPTVSWPMSLECRCGHRKLVSVKELISKLNPAVTIYEVARKAIR
jgi:hypothetical protein